MKSDFLASGRQAALRLTGLALVAISMSTGSVFAAEAAKGEVVKIEPAKGGKIAQEVCAACHGPDGNSALPVNPILAGQHEVYLAKQLHEFRPQGDKPALRANAIMSGFAAQLSEADIRNLSAYFAAQPIKPSAAKDKDLSEQGKHLYRSGIAAKGVPSCAGCHGPSGAGIPVQYPRLSGQHATYTASQLTAFRQGERANSVQMAQIAARLSDTEIAALADYIAGLR